MANKARWSLRECDQFMKRCWTGKGYDVEKLKGEFSEEEIVGLFITVLGLRDLQGWHSYVAHGLRGAIQRLENPNENWLAVLWKYSRADPDEIHHFFQLIRFTCGNAVAIWLRPRLLWLRRYGMEWQRTLATEKLQKLNREK